MDKIGILLMAYGSPSSMDDVESYYTHIRRGNPPSPEQLEELMSRYRAIGGVSPLSEITRSQSEALAELLADHDKGLGTFSVYSAFKHTAPFISDVVGQMAKDHISTVIGLVLAPHYSTLSVGVYEKEAKEAAAKAGISMHVIPDWYQQENLNIALVERLRECLSSVSPDSRLKVLFSAHSLPERILQVHDPYPVQLMEHSGLLAKRAMVQDWQFAWQSAGRTKDPWLGPDILDVLSDLKRQGVEAVISCPIGFIADHLEVLYDLDIEAKALARTLGIDFIRTESLNANPLLIGAIKQAILNYMAQNGLQ